MRIVRTTTVTAAAVGLAAMLAACSVSHAGTTASSGSGSAPVSSSSSGSKTIEFIPSEDSTPYFLQEYQGIKQAAAKYGYNTVYQAPDAISDISQQIGMMSTAISDSVKGIILVPSSPTALISSAEEAESKGIPVIATDSSLNAGSKTYISVPDQPGRRQGPVRDHQLQHVDHLGHPALQRLPAGHERLPGD
jgi:ABC-type sugar transport system substrate-binding protein